MRNLPLSEGLQWWCISVDGSLARMKRNIEFWTLTSEGGTLPLQYLIAMKALTSHEELSENDCTQPEIKSPNAMLARRRMARALLVVIR
jgi:hypothetical protein